MGLTREEQNLSEDRSESLSRATGKHVGETGRSLGPMGTHGDPNAPPPSPTQTPPGRPRAARTPPGDPGTHPMGLLVTPRCSQTPYWYIYIYI